MILALLVAASSGSPQPERMDVALWVTAGYGAASSSGPITSPPESGFALDAGAQALFHVGGPFHVGALVDYGLVGPNALLVAPALGLAFGDLLFSGGFGYATLKEGGFGALLAADYRVLRWLSVRAQGTWQHSSYTGLQNPGPVIVDIAATIWSATAGLALRL